MKKITKRRKGLRKVRKLDHKSITFLHKKARKIFAHWIVRRDNHRCFTCGKYGDQAGHFIHQDAMDFSEEGNQCQDAACNYFRSGNLVVYAINLERKYGPGIIQKLKAEADKNHIWKRKELLEIIEKYK